jgi:hypothetical protein
MKVKFFFIILLGTTDNTLTKPIALLATALKNVASSSVSENGLLGPWLYKKYPKKLIAYDKNFKNTGAHVYQIKVLKQWQGDCWIHAFRNSLFIMDLALAPRKNFGAIYGDMINRDQYEAFIKYGCPLVGNVTRKFIEKQLTCRPHCIPEKSLEYEKNSLVFNYEPEFSQQTLENSTKTLDSIEKNHNNQQIIFDFTLLSEKINFQEDHIDRLITLMHNLKRNQNYCCSITFTSNYIQHEISLVIHKYNNTIEYLFSDSNNISFKGDNYSWHEGNVIYTQMMGKQKYAQWVSTFTNAINQFIFWIQNPEYFDAMMVRILYVFTMKQYYAYKQLNINTYGIDNWKRIAQYTVKELSKFYESLQSHKLLENDLYLSTYKKKYCSIIQEEQKQQQKSNLYQELLKKVCS